MNVFKSIDLCIQYQAKMGMAPKTAHLQLMESYGPMLHLKVGGH